ncbi:MAG: hypothetical protein HY644_09085 [Acidobacteria bacterium]|nr:hypothetical protein [Acidobacteriota bacterium]
MLSVLVLLEIYTLMMKEINVDVNCANCLLCAQEVKSLTLSFRVETRMQKAESRRRPRKIDNTAV